MAWFQFSAAWQLVVAYQGASFARLSSFYFAEARNGGRASAGAGLEPRWGHRPPASEGRASLAYAGTSAGTARRGRAPRQLARHEHQAAGSLGAAHGRTRQLDDAFASGVLRAEQVKRDFRVIQNEREIVVEIFAGSHGEGAQAVKLDRE